MEKFNLKFLSERFRGAEIHVWPVKLVAPPGYMDTCYAVLSSDERDRAKRFRFDKHRRLFVLARSVLRGFLGRYLGVAAPDVLFAYGPEGKPSLAVDCQIRFNVSHSGNRALYAFTLGCELGVDIEEIRPLPDLESIARSMFSAEESRELAAISEPQRTEAFFNCWTRKEAFIKAVGCGLSVPLDGFRVTMHPEELPRLVHMESDPIEAASWALYHLKPSRGYVGALAVRDTGRPLRIWPSFSAGKTLDRLQNGAAFPEEDDSELFGAA
jgi:4'-phosphopantetheinyl transferase